VTFSGSYAQSRNQPVIYVTERCVFQLTPDGLDLIEVAPGIDIDRDILAHMDFTPTITKPIVMDRRIFMDAPMDLLSDLLNLKLGERVSYDAERNILFLNLEGWSVRKKSDIDDLKKVIVDACQAAGRRVNSVVNHDGFRLADDLYDDYANLIGFLSEHYYATTTRHTTSTFMRVKMQEALKRRGLRPHIFERAEDANMFLEQQAAE
jgi:propionate CoA-transferase